MNEAMQKALAGSRAVSQRQLCAAARALHAALPPGEVIYSRIVPIRGASACIVVTWPGDLMMLEPDSGEIIREVPAASLAVRSDVVAYFMADAMRRGKPLRAARFHPPQGQPLVAAYGADCVLRVRTAKGGKLLAESVPGQPEALRADFCVLTPQDLAPRLS